MPTFKLTLRYDGTDFAGWQVQPGQETIQGQLQSAARELTGIDIHVIGSGRTDAGVHALGQVASLTLPDWEHGSNALMRALNTQLPATIVVFGACQVPDQFHAIRDATSKRYRYQLQIGGVRDVFDYRHRWHLKGPLDIAAMKTASQHFIGRHDFASFQAAGAKRKSTVRNVTACDFVEQPTDQPGRTDLAIEIEADGFLYNMVRNIVGTLVEVGWGKRSADSIAEILQQKARDAAGQTAPAHGLFLLRVSYREVPLGTGVRLTTKL